MLSFSLLILGAMGSPSHVSSKCVKLEGQPNVEFGKCCGFDNEITCAHGFRRVSPKPNVCGGDCPKAWCSHHGKLKDVRSYECVPEAPKGSCVVGKDHPVFPGKVQPSGAEWCGRTGNQMVCDNGKIIKVSTGTCDPLNDISPELKKIPTNPDDFGEPAWEEIIEAAFPVWEIDGPCGSLTMVGGELDIPMPGVVGSTAGKFNPCYYTKRFAGLDPSYGGYPTPIDTKYPYEHAAPFTGQPGDGSVHHCDCDADAGIAIGSCPKVGHDCGPDCASIDSSGKIGHVPPFVPLAAVKREYAKWAGANWNDGARPGAKADMCGQWFDFESSGCNIKPKTLDRLVKKYFGGDDDTIKWQPPILIDGKPSSTYFKLEYGGEGCGDDGVVCFGPHYCTADVGETNAWGDFCPYVHVGENSGKYRHPHIALAALETWIASQCMPQQCSSKWLENNPDYPPTRPTSITWSEMDDNSDPMAQPLVPYTFPITAGEVPDLTDRTKCAPKAPKGTKEMCPKEYSASITKMIQRGFGERKLARSCSDWGKSGMSEDEICTCLYALHGPNYRKFLDSLEDCKIEVELRGKTQKLTLRELLLEQFGMCFGDGITPVPKGPYTPEQTQAALTVVERTLKGLENPAFAPLPTALQDLKGMDSDVKSARRSLNQFSKRIQKELKHEEQPASAPKH